MTFESFISILRARKWLVLGVFFGVVALVVAISLLLPKQYLGTASVVIDAKPDPVTALANPAAALPSFMATQVDILVSDRVALRVIRDLKLLDNPGLRQQWQEDTDGVGTIEQWLVDLLQKKLDVKPSRESNVIVINYKSPDPKFAAGLANAFAKAYIETTLELRVDPAQQFTKFFDSQTNRAREAMERAQSKVSAFQQAKGIIATDERFDVESLRLNDLSSQLTQLQALLAESTSRQGQARGGQGDQMAEVLNNPVVIGLKTDLARAEAKLKELTQRLGDANPQVSEARANIAELRNRIDAEASRATGGVSVSNNINRQREAQLRRDIEAQRAKVLQLKVVRDEGLLLQHEADNAQLLYTNLVARLSQTNLEAQANQSYANVLTTAQPPALPSSPKLLLNIGLSVFLGQLLAIGLAMLLEFRDRRIRGVDDVVSALGLPVLGSLPKPNAKRFIDGHRSQLSSQSLLGLPPANPLREA